MLLSSMWYQGASPKSSLLGVGGSQRGEGSTGGYEHKGSSGSPLPPMQPQLFSHLASDQVKHKYILT